MPIKKDSFFKAKTFDSKNLPYSQGSSGKAQPTSKKSSKMTLQVNAP